MVFMPSPPDPDDEYSDEGIARRRDETIRRMLNTPPQPRTKKPPTGAKMGRPESVKPE